MLSLSFRDTCYLVLGTGFEPARLTATASKTVVYANSTTRAHSREPPERFEYQLIGGNHDVRARANPHRDTMGAVKANPIRSPMKTQRTLLLALAALSPAIVVFTGGCSKSTDTKVSDAVQDTTTAVKGVAIDIKDDAVATWNRIKDVTYDKRSDFTTGINNATQKMDDKVAELKTKFTPETPERAKAQKDYDEARAELKAKLTDLGNATADTWADAKAQVSKAWDKVEASYDNLTK